MRTSVVLPTFNSVATIRDTLDAALAQTLPPDEIIVVDDGSTDGTVAVLNSYQPRIAVIQQSNKGVAAARNVLCREARGELLAFLDHDDIWHPQYLEIQHRVFHKYPQAVALFAGHVDFRGFERYLWPTLIDASAASELIGPVDFATKYNKTTGLFSSMSFCCVPKSILKQLGAAPFQTSTTGADDYYLFNALPLLGSVAYNPTRLVAYRISDTAQSADRLKGLASSIRALELLRQEYDLCGDAMLLGTFREAVAARRRQYSKFLLGVGDKWEARTQLVRSIRESPSLQSFAKSLCLLLTTGLPRGAQPSWPSRYRV